MRLLHLHLSDFRSYQDADIDLSSVQLASVVGPNGSGKSSLLEAVVFALTGARGMRSLDAFIRQGQEECRVALTFSTGGETYRLTRTRSNRGSGKSTVELARQDESGLWIAEGTGARDTDERVRAVLGVDEETLLQTAIVAQGDAGSFFALRPAQRLEALGAILKLDERFGPLERWFKVSAEAARTYLDAARRDAERLEGAVERLVEREQEFAEAQRAVAQSQGEEQRTLTIVKWAQQQTVEARDAAADYELAVAKRDEVLKRREDLEYRVIELDDEADRLLDRVARREELESELARRGDLEAARERQIQYREQDQAIEADRRRLTEAVMAAEAALAQARSGWKAQDQHCALARQAGDVACNEADRAQASVDTIEKKIDAIHEATSPVCDRCGQPIADAARDKTLDGLERELDATGDALYSAHERADEADAVLEAECNSLALLSKEGEAAHAVLESRQAELAALPAPVHDRLQLAYAERELAALAEIPAQLAIIATLEERLDVVRSEAESVATALGAPELVESLSRADAAVREAEDARRAFTEAEAKEKAASRSLEVARTVLSLAEKAAARLEGEVNSLAPCREQLAEARAAATTHEREQSDAELLRKAMSKWGVPALIVQNVLLSLEVEVNELLALYEGSLALRFEGERETRDGSRDSLEIVCFDGSAWRAFETFSGGERYRVASAMRLGLARLLAHRSGARVETLIVDEPEGLDAPGRAHLAAILARMAEDFGVVLLLTHYADLQDAMPQQIVVSRGEDGLSRAEVAA